MSAKHRLGLLGKHPGFGDFLSAGLEDEAERILGDWAQQVLGAWRAQTGPDWQDAFDSAPMINLWIGAAVTGRAMRGVWCASHDRSGRRFPLLLLQNGGAAPVLDPDPRFYQAASKAIEKVLATETFDLREMLDSLQLPIADDSPEWPTFWALNPSLEPDMLLPQLSSADHAHATAARSYWWFGGLGAPSGLLACQGLPGVTELGWLLTHGRVSEAA